jgi:hypothetical protein
MHETSVLSNSDAFNRLAQNIRIYDQGESVEIIARCKGSLEGPLLSSSSLSLTLMA